MGTPYIVSIVLLVIALVIFVVVKLVDRREERAFFEKMQDPEFARQYHEIHKYDDWEDMGYFDGR